MDRKVWAFALVGVAAVLRLAGRRIDDARLVLTGVAPIPWRARAAERALIGAEPGPALFERAAEAALADAQPLAHNGYKLPLARALIRRALETLGGRAGTAG
jgi:xanthine dehydrogenase YagS FAD-binding subunit